MTEQQESQPKKTAKEVIEEHKRERVREQFKVVEGSRRPDDRRDVARLTPFQFLDVIGWQDKPIPRREWTVPDRIPAANVTLLSGDGGIGKTMLALHLAVAVTLGRDWLGRQPQTGPAVVICCEDSGDELHRRIDRIVTYCEAKFSDLADLHMLSLAGQDAVMGAPDRSDVIRPTRLFEQVLEAGCDIRPKLIVIDNAADVFAGNENDRAHVRQFVNQLRGLAMQADAGVLMTSHPSLTGMSTGTGLSGSTAWHNSVRSRLYFKKATTEKDEEPDPDMRVLETMKNNYGPNGETILLRWNSGLFVPINSGIGSLTKMAAEQHTDDLFLKLLDQFSRAGRNVSEKPTAPTYAPTVFAKESTARGHGIGKSGLEASMRRLFSVDKIHVETYGPPSRGWSRIAKGSRA
jgi:RecA-family ATPase